MQAINQDKKTFKINSDIISYGGNCKNQARYLTTL
tara:strand:+ start:277 stop:381 length:105 start_codon:yes stop_codon:yes gene_type:complete